MVAKAPDGLARMRALAVEMPGHVRVGFAAARELAAEIPRATRKVVVVGMGGSAIAADLVRGVTDPELEVALEVGRGPSLPRAIDGTTLTIFMSYSGGTWETLAAFDEAGRRGATRVTVGSGGELARRAERQRIPHLHLPQGLPPRAAVGYMLGGLFGLLDPFFPESNEGRLTRAATRVADRQGRLASPKGVPAQLAKRVGARTPEFYADVPLASLARRWKTQVEENAKRLAHFDLFPELFHNAIVGWDAMTPTEARRWAVVFLEAAGQNPALAPGVDYLEGLLKRRRVPTLRVRIEGEDRIETLLMGVSLGDHLSLALAEAAGVDPLPVEAIGRLKAAVDRA